MKSLLGEKPIQLEINKGIITIKDEAGSTLFSLKGKVKIESSLRVPECEKCNSEGRKRELEALESDRKTLNTRDSKLSERESAVQLAEEKLKRRENDIKSALKTLQE